MESPVLLVPLTLAALLVALWTKRRIGMLIILALQVATLYVVVSYLIHLIKNF